MFTEENVNIKVEQPQNGRGWGRRKVMGRKQQRAWPPMMDTDRYQQKLEASGKRSLIIGLESAKETHRRSKKITLRD